MIKSPIKPHHIIHFSRKKLCVQCWTAEIQKQKQKINNILLANGLPTIINNNNHNSCIPKKKINEHFVQNIILVFILVNFDGKTHQQFRTANYSDGIVIESNKVRRTKNIK